MKIISRSSGRFNIVFDRILEVFAAVSGVAIITIMLSTFFQVIARYFFHAGAAWITEVVNGMMLYMTFLGVAWILKIHGHIAVDVIYTRQSPKTRLILDLIISVIGIVSCLVMAWYSGQTTADNLLRGIKISATLQVSRGLFLGALPLGFLLLLIEFIRQFLGHLARLRTSNN